MSSTEGVHHIAISVRSQGLGEVFLTSFHLFLGRLISRVIFLDANGFAFLFGIEAQVLKQQHLACLQCSSFSLCLGAIGSELHLSNAQRLGYSVLNLTEAVLGSRLAFGLTHVAHDNKRTTVSKDMLQRRQSTADTGVVGDVTVFVQGHIKVHTDNRLLSGELVIVNRHHNCIILVC